MRPIFAAAILAMLVLAACSSSTPTPTATSVPPTQAPVATNAPVESNPIGTMAATLGIPQAGTMVIPNNNLTPNAPTPAPITFTDLNFSQTGGIASISISIDLRGDGTLTRDGKISKVTQDDIDNIDKLLDAVHFFDLQGIFMGPGATADAYTYTLTVTNADRSRTITSQDGMTPAPLNQIYDAIRNLNNT